ncbi:MAG: cobalamin biosynthesis protein CobD [Candidatus Tectomicrobia bacterium]|uniref:Cobalamin biosynthesis protein CobD n=1 Tax=Tectimicrobiota bacterium TaxID=2528274 RepID=A0A932CQ20_UNCTE|nr:cobalamin biosynthesis protein CobD [Candidatus Tectomicrobia bacterium]
MQEIALSILAAYILDLLLGDPHWFPHPVRGIGWAIRQLEALLRASRLNEWLAGCLLTITVVGGAYLLTWGLLQGARTLHPGLGFVLSTLLIYTSLAARSLYRESMRVARLLKRGALEEGRRQVGGLVGRDTQNLDEREITRATVETVAENLVDGVISPLFYAFLGGAPLALAYKAVSTLDSMVGYKSPRYLRFGWASARLDDLANYLPARITALLLPLAALLCRQDMWGCWAAIRRDGRKNPSPNSGLPEAGVAGALGIQLGGMNYYGGVPSPKPLIGMARKPLEVKDIREANRLMMETAFLALLLGELLLGWVG